MALVATALRRTRLAAYGLTRECLRAQFRAAAAGAPPVLVISAALYWLGWTSWGDAIALSALQVIVLLALGWMLRGWRDEGAERWAGLALLLPPALLLAAQPGAVAWRLPVRLLATFALVAPAEEMLFRGYIQTRLNEAFGRPYRMLEAGWGWGLVLTAILFGVWHLVSPFDPFSGRYELAWTWGLWTAFAGLLLGWARERTGGLVAPWLWHGLINL